MAPNLYSSLSETADWNAGSAGDLNQGLCAICRMVHNSPSGHPEAEFALMRIAVSPRTGKVGDLLKEAMNGCKQ